MRKILSAIVLGLLILSACSAAPVQSTPPEEPISLRASEVTEIPAEPAPYLQPEIPAAENASAEPYPPPSVMPTPAPYPLPVTGLEPQAGDESLARGNVFLELADSGLLVMETFPIQVNLHLSGSLPNPCHKLRVVEQLDQAQFRVNLDVYSVIDTSVQCTEVIQDLDVTLPLGSFLPGHYSVYLNGELLGEFDA